MLDELFGKASTVVHHKLAPYLSERERYLSHCAQQDYSQNQLKKTAAVLLSVIYQLRNFPDLRVGEEELQAATERAVRMQAAYLKTGSIRHFQKLFAREAKRWLCYLGRFKETAVKPLPFADLIEEFATWMERERGLSPATIDNRRRHLKSFLSWYGTPRRPISALGLTDVDTFQAACHARGLSRVAIKNHTNAIRAFVRYAGSRHWCSPALSEGIHGPRMYRQENLPSGPSWDDVKRLLASTESDSPVDVRDRAIIMLFAIYGFRASEVSGLCLGDIDWEHDRITVPRCKQRRSQTYPLVPSVGQAIIRYLKEVRPKCIHRKLFVTILAPRRSMSRKNLYQVVAARMERLGIKSLPHHGPHALRHACATHLVAKGFTLKEIGDHLGHNSPSATRIYAKVDMPGLQEVAAFDLGGVL